ncbi:class C sortase [Macrococcus epidermidis]|uniref:class C sortase n=1 Tax=Macrococcus epidermidis TaxID=1902580 RepID=UPI0020B6BC16|nr:class C sortase [Macrococcus epidermidis]UTH15995.1 class C sortase [Macrococcus epidermidis]
MEESKSIKKQNNLLFNIIFLFIFGAGALILLYPMISAVYYDYQASEEVNTFNKEVGKLMDKDIEERIREAQAYNATLMANEAIADTFSEQEKAEGKALYARMIEVNEQIGYVEVPSIHQKLPLFAGTREEVLQKGLGHLERTSLPVGGKNTHTVITGHRGLPDKMLFTDLNKVKQGDKVYITNIKETLAYEIDHIEVVKPDQTEKLRIAKHEDRLTLLTCTPYMINSHRLIVQGHRIPYTPVEAKQHLAQQPAWWMKFLSVYKYYLIGFVISIILYVIYKILNKRKKRAEQ